MKLSENPDMKNFSIVLGGPFFQLLRKVHLTGNALELLKQRTLIIALLAWLPLFVFSLIKGSAWGEGTNLPFIEDFEVHIRFLLALPLMIFAELIIHERLQNVVQQFEERNLIPETARAQFDKAIHSAYRLRNSLFAEAFIVILIYVIGYNVVWNKSMALETTAWYSEPEVGNSHLSLAGIWFRYVSLPMFQFLLLRWYYRIFIWSRFLFHVSRIKLTLVPTHPDYVGGLSFLSNIVFAFMPLGIAHGAVIAGMISNHIFHEGAMLLDFKIEIIIITVVVLFITLFPMFFFSGQLSDIKRIGSLRYGKFAADCVQAFDTRWIKENTAVNTSSSLNSDIQGLSDLSNSYQVIQKMQIIPITRTDILLLAVGTLAPIVPLVLTMMPLSDLIKMLSGILF
jgi:hypothetical protein